MPFQWAREISPGDLINQPHSIGWKLKMREILRNPLLSETDYTYGTPHFQETRYKVQALLTDSEEYCGEMMP
jgi:hypothetical protein